MAAERDINDAFADSEDRGMYCMECERDSRTISSRDVELARTAWRDVVSNDLVDFLSEWLGHSCILLVLD